MSFHSRVFWFWFISFIISSYFSRFLPHSSLTDRACFSPKSLCSWFSWLRLPVLSEKLPDSCLLPVYHCFAITPYAFSFQIPLAKFFWHPLTLPYSCPYGKLTLADIHNLVMGSLVYFIFEFSFWSWAAKQVKVKKLKKKECKRALHFGGVYQATE